VIRRLRNRPERGATLVEIAFVLPVLFIILLSMFDLGDWSNDKSLATGAARDGARIGIIYYDQADVKNTAAGTDWTNVDNAIKARLQNKDVKFEYENNVGPVCVGPNDDSPLSNGCSSAIVGCDRILVRISWERTPFSPIGRLFGTADVEGEATMVVVGEPGVNPTAPSSNGCANP
jgi:hypothetical protein